MELLGCVPNVTVGNDRELVKYFADILGYCDVFLVDSTYGEDEGRAIFTFVGDFDGIERAVFSLMTEVIKHINVHEVSGNYPRVGALDLLPFVPLKHVSMEEVVEFSKRVGKRIAEHFNIPVFLYGNSATKDYRKDLEFFRKYTLKDLEKLIGKRDEWEPDFGPKQLHPTAGTVLVGARQPLMSVEVELEADSFEIVEKLASTLDKTTGGFVNVQAFPVKRGREGSYAVFLNFLDYKQTPISLGVETLRMEADRLGAKVKKVEPIGVYLTEALISSLGYYWGFKKFSLNEVLEYKLSTYLEEEEFSFESVASKLASAPCKVRPSLLALSVLQLVLGFVLGEVRKKLYEDENFRYRASVISQYGADLRAAIKSVLAGEGDPEDIRKKILSVLNNFMLELKECEKLGMSRNSLLTAFEMIKGVVTVLEGRVDESTLHELESRVNAAIDEIEAR